MSFWEFPLFSAQGREGKILHLHPKTKLEDVGYRVQSFSYLLVSSRLPVYIIVTLVSNAVLYTWNLLTKEILRVLTHKK